MAEYYILKDSVPVPADSVMEWAIWFDNPDNRLVEVTQVGNVEVSTVFLGINHNWGDGPPLLYETMIFKGKYHEWQWRYATLEEARAGHQQAVELVTEGGQSGDSLSPMNRGSF